MVDLDCLVSHTDHALFQQRLSERLARRQMQISEENLAFAQQWEFRFEWFFDFHYHVGARKNVFWLLDDFRAGFDVVLVCVTRSESGIRFHQNGMTMFSKLVCTGRQQRNALLLFLNLLWDTDNH